MEMMLVIVIVIFFLGYRTFEKNFANGIPPSRANAYICREVVATLLIPAHACIASMMAVIPVAPETDLVAFTNTGIKGNPCCGLMISSISWMQKAYVMIMISPLIPLMTRVQTIAKGRTREASLISSAVILWSARSKIRIIDNARKPFHTHMNCGVRTNQRINRRRKANQARQAIIPPPTTVLDGVENVAGAVPWA